MKTWKKVVILLAALISLAVVPVIVSADNGTNRGTKIPYEMHVFIPCANNGDGEMVHFTGYKHWFEYGFLDGNGGYHVRVHLNPHKFTGYGEFTGDLYRMVGASNRHEFYFPPDDGVAVVPRNATFTATYPIISKGHTVKMFMHDVERFVLNAKGELVVDFHKFHVTCK